MPHDEPSMLFSCLNLSRKALAALSRLSIHSKPGTESPIKSCLQNCNLSFIPEEVLLSLKLAYFLDLKSKHCFGLSSFKCNKPNEI